MYETRDDSFVRPQEVLNHFRRNIEQVAMQKLHDAFKAAWEPPLRVNCPLDFEVNVSFGRVLPTDVADKVCKELKDHGWTNYSLTIDNDQHRLSVKLDSEEAKKYARV